MAELHKSVAPFLRYFITKVNSFPVAITIADSKGLDVLYQHLTDCLYELRRVIQLYKEYVQLKSTVPKMNEIETELHKLVQGFVRLSQKFIIFYFVQR